MQQYITKHWPCIIFLRFLAGYHRLWQAPFVNQCPVSLHQEVSVQEGNHSANVFSLWLAHSWFFSQSLHIIFTTIRIYKYIVIISMYISCISWSTYSHQWLLEICTLRLIHWPWIALVARRCSPGCQEQRKLRVRWLWLPGDVGTNPKWTEPTSESSMGRPQAAIPLHGWNQDWD